VVEGVAARLDRRFDDGDVADGELAVGGEYGDQGGRLTGDRDVGLPGADEAVPVAAGAGPGLPGVPGLQLDERRDADDDQEQKPARGGEDPEEA
jgi:hypothetical protein